MRLLITGATGFAGNALLDVLPGAVSWTSMRILALPGDPGLLRVLSKGIRGLQVVEGDITDPVAVGAAVKDATHVIHLAGLVSHWGRDRDRLTSINRDGARVVAQACVRERVQRLVHVSSVGAVGFYPDGRLADESTPFNWPESFPYMTTKHAGQVAVEEEVRSGGLNAIILNPASLMGPGDPDPGSAHNRLYGSIARGPLLGCFSGGLGVTDVRDLASLIVKALTRGAAGERYLAIGSNQTYVAVVREIGRCFGRPVFPFRIPPFLLTAAGAAMELSSAVTGRRPLLTAAYGRLSGWYQYHSNARSIATFDHGYTPFSKTIADGCAFYAAAFGQAAGPEELMRAVLVTGANGFIGSHLCDAFLGNGYEVYGLVRPTADLRFLRDPRVRLVRGDLTSLDTIAFPPSLDVIVHAAALVSDNATAEQARTHVLGITTGLAGEAWRRYPGLSRFIYVSSALVLGYGADNISENAPGRSASYVPYNRMKMQAEEHLLSLYREKGLPVVILRPGDVYGPRDRTSCEQMMRAAEKGVPLRVGSGRRHFGLCSPSNLCQAALAAAVRPAVVGKAYTVANGVSPTWREFFDALQNGVGKPQRVYVPVSLLMAAAILVEIVRRLAPAMRPSINWYRIRRITSQTTYSISTTVQDLGYTPDNDYPALFESIVRWYRQEKSAGAGKTATP